MECHQRYTTFRDMFQFGNELEFWTKCVNLETDPKPQVRLHGAVSYFNITNFAQFENIEFTAVDALAKINPESESDFN